MISFDESLWTSVVLEVMEFFSIEFKIVLVHVLCLGKTLRELCG